MVGESRITNSILRMIGEDARNEINNYVDDISSRNFMVMSSNEQVNRIFMDSYDTFVSSLTNDELMDLRSYTGYNFRNINAILRGNWSYDVNGQLSSEKNIEFRKLASSVNGIVSKFHMPSIDFVTFRGTTINSFSSYGISELSQLVSLKGKFLYEQGFTSTSIIEDTCYFDKKLETGENYNIEVRYLISSECDSGALLMGDAATYSTGQNEFLINSGSLSKVLDVKIIDGKAILTVALIPKKIYDRDYIQDKNSARGTN